MVQDHTTLVRELNNDYFDFDPTSYIKLNNSDSEIMTSQEKLENIKYPDPNDDTFDVISKLNNQTDQNIKKDQDKYKNNMEELLQKLDSIEIPEKGSIEIPEEDFIEIPEEDFIEIPEEDFIEIINSHKKIYELLKNISKQSNKYPLNLYINNFRDESQNHIKNNINNYKNINGYEDITKIIKNLTEFLDKNNIQTANLCEIFETLYNNDK